ncbi:hypothetical protein EZV62_000945 [Acer yangbiense]|uniref:GAG-pre-integrase domain-containing protein n=1 Tax=Acer yangbiense TaxID=1000413 RepID=A0A5C7IV43_9ROSI|nr:hypothetical protein EZV62_000938 [Acer yangbiense]TXG72366.1 hypothetical protein EZV62_000945 [Acer yangbiense]
MDASKGLGKNLDDFKKMTIELTNAGEDEKLSDENEAIILLNSLPDSFKDVKAAIKYGRSSLSLEECISALKSKELELKIEKKDNGENLFVRASKISDKGILWHMRLGHMSERGVLELSKRGLLNGDQVKIVEENPIEDDRAAHSDGMHQVIEGQNQPEVTNPLADYELVRDRVRRISKPNISLGSSRAQRSPNIPIDVSRGRGS